MVLIDKQILTETNKALKELYLSMSKEKKHDLSQRLMKLDEFESPHKFERWGGLELFNVKAFIMESPKRRKSLKKFGPEKNDVDLLIFRSYYLLEYSLFQVLKYYTYTRSNSDPVSQALQIGYSCQNNKLSYSVYDSMIDPILLYAGTFFYDEYPYDDIVDKVINSDLFR